MCACAFACTCASACPCVCVCVCLCVCSLSLSLFLSLSLSPHFRKFWKTLESFRNFVKVCEFCEKLSKTLESSRNFGKVCEFCEKIWKTLESFRNFGKVCEFCENAPGLSRVCPRSAPGFFFFLPVSILFPMIFLGNLGINGQWSAEASKRSWITSKTYRF